MMGITILGLSSFAFSEEMAQPINNEEITQPQAMAEEQAQKSIPMDEEMMARWKKYSTPNENHQTLNQIVGSWDYTIRH
ncbi:MAG: hypothetical protein Q7S13_04360 [Candidatus Omnitrophota bacterium]|nr:hypothetical protein [Candidatus Omnitrophota bacterium]